MALDIIDIRIVVGIDSIATSIDVTTALAIIDNHVVNDIDSIANGVNI